jgi:hypothetical protein
VTVSLWFEFEGEQSPEKGDPFEIRLEQRAWLVMAPSRGRLAYDDFDQLLTRIRWFFGFVAGAQDQLLELRGEATVQEHVGGGRMRAMRRPVWVLFAPPALQAAEPRSASEMLFTRVDVPGTQVARPLTRWLTLCRRLSLDPVLGPYFAALARASMHADIRFFVFAGAAEAYHARRKPPPKRKKIYFETRMAALVNQMPRKLRALVPDGFAEEVKHTRNFGAHRDEKSRSKAATGTRLYAIMELLKLVFDVAILRELGFTQTEIATLIDRNPRITGTLRVALDYLASTKPGR